MRLRFFHRCLFTLAYGALAAGCSTESEPHDIAEAAKASSGDSAVNNAVQSDLLPPADESLTLKQLAEAGMPAHDRDWSGVEMARAAKILSAIAQKNPGHLPRHRSQLSGEAFARLIANENLNSYLNRSLPLEQRLPDALDYMQSSNQIFKLYLSAFNQNVTGDSEMVELADSQLRVSVVMIKLVNEFLPTLKTDDPTYASRMDGLKQMKNGMATVVAGNLITLTESHAYRTSELKRLAGYMQSTLPAILPELTMASRTETVTQLRSFSEDPKMHSLNPELEQLLDAVEKSAQAEKTP